MDRYKTTALMMKALAEPMRLAILDMISCQEMCACQLLENLNISQSTLSHHMRVLQMAELVISRKDATWIFYSINPEIIHKLHENIDALILPKEDCICFSTQCKPSKKNNEERQNDCKTITE